MRWTEDHFILLNKLTLSVSYGFIIEMLKFL